MPSKEELMAEAKKLGVSLPGDNLTKSEIQALLQDFKDMAKATDEPETMKFKKDPMTGLSSLTRGRLDKILDNLQETANLPAKSPRKACQLKTKGHVMLAIREIMSKMDRRKIKNGKLMGSEFQDLKEMPGYMNWILREINEESHPHMISMAQYLKLWMGLEKPDRKSEEEDSSGPELMKDSPQWLEPDWTEIKQSKPPTVETEIKIVKENPKPEWNGEPGSWNEFQEECRQWLLKKQDSQESNSKKTEIKPETKVKIERK